MVEDEKRKLILLLGNKHYPDRGIQCVAQFSYTLVRNRYVFSSVRGKFLKFLFKIAHLLTFNI